MSGAESSVRDERATALLSVVSYVSQPKQFIAVADARAALRRTLEMAAVQTSPTPSSTTT